jgi:hypothetical protein
LFDRLEQKPGVLEMATRGGASKTGFGAKGLGRAQR